MRLNFNIPDALVMRGLVIQGGAPNFEYHSIEQGVRFYVKIITKRSEFKSAFETPNIHLIYDGHARYGRGPCFGLDDSSYVPPHRYDEIDEEGHRVNRGAGEQWEQGASNEDGIFRMGYPYIGVPILEIISHGYTPNPVESTEKINREDCDPDIADKKFQVLTAKELPSGHTIPGMTGSKKKWWGYKAGSGWHVVLHAGWTGTRSTPMDLGAITPKCRVFCHFGCSTFRHNAAILRTRKKWRREGDDKFAYWTSAPSSSMLGPAWLYHLFTYPHHNAFQNWGPSLEYAKTETNIEIKSYYQNSPKDLFQII
jgi:hypothetical protein